MFRFFVHDCLFFKGNKTEKFLGVYFWVNILLSIASLLLIALIK